jgi:hypothetical protein
VALFVLVGCQLAQSALAGTYLKTRPPIVVPLQQVDESSALITFVRRYIYLGDTVIFDVWDGETYIGELLAGRTLQYKATPGPHTFMMMKRGLTAWSFIKADVAVGKEYFIKGNFTPFHLGGADARTDVRVEEWRTMSTSRGSEKYLKNAQAALHAFNSGVVTRECPVWLPPLPGKKYREQPTPDPITCAPLNDMPPEFGR